jgi:bifunctional UDP-N-acetylglucosamine pyrophosphorylase/glucosamine-1-phosphate N-acetyltransferase
MKSELLKVAHRVAGKPIITFVVDAVLEVPVQQVALVVGHQAETIRQMTQHERVSYVFQSEQNGTGHAALMAEPEMTRAEDETVIILAGDCPLIQTDTIRHLLDVHRETNAAASILTTRLPDPGSYGRVLRGRMGSVVGIREARDCTEAELKINEVNTGVYCFQSRLLFDALHQVRPDNSQHEFYLTDVIQILKTSGHAISAYCTPDSDQTLGINTRMDLARINQIIYQRNNQHFMQEGVTLLDPSTTFIDATVTIGRDTEIYPFSIISGHSVIGQNCRIGPHAVIQDSVLADHTVVLPFEHIVNRAHVTANR